jgi:hypothetical protein
LHKLETFSLYNYLYRIKEEEDRIRDIERRMEAERRKEREQDREIRREQENDGRKQSSRRGSSSSRSRSRSRERKRRRNRSNSPERSRHRVNAVNVKTEERDSKTAATGSAEATGNDLERLWESEKKSFPSWAQ